MSFTDRIEILRQRSLMLADELGEAIAGVIDAHLTYVELPDGRQVNGFKVMSETLSDGSTAQTIVLLTTQDDPAEASRP